MTQSEVVQLYRKNEKKGRPFNIMVQQENGVWSQVTVIGLSISGKPIFSGWYVSGCFQVKQYMTIDGYNAVIAKKGQEKKDSGIPSNQYY